VLEQSICACQVCCRVLQCVAVYCGVMQCVAVCCSVLRCAAVCCIVLQCVAVCYKCGAHDLCVSSVVQCVAVYCGVVLCVAVCCSVLQCVAVCYKCVAHKSTVFERHGNQCLCFLGFSVLGLSDICVNEFLGFREGSFAKET